MVQNSKNEIQYNFTLHTGDAQKEIKKLETSLMRILSYVQMLTPGNTELNKLIAMTQTTITMLRTTQLAIRAVQLAAGPVGWLYAGTSIVAAGFSGYSIYESLTGV
jgi:hypothetical protein